MCDVGIQLFKSGIAALAECKCRTYATAHTHEDAEEDDSNDTNDDEDENDVRLHWR